MSKDKEEFTGQRGRKALTPSQKRGKAGPGRPANDPPVAKKPGIAVDTFLPEAPGSIDIDAQAEWERIGPWLELTERVSKLDYQALFSYCSSLVVFGESIRPLIIGRDNLWGEVNDKPRPAKASEVAYEHGKIALDVAQKFGMTARTRHLDHQQGAGRPALPKEIHELRGSPKKHPSRKPLPEWPEGSVERPAWLSGPVAESEWNRLTSVLSNLDLLTPLDVGIVAIACGSFSLMSRCMDQMREERIVLPLQDGGGIEHPLSLIYRKHFDLCSSVWQDYGMSPADRMRFVHAEGEKQGKPKLSIYPESTG